MILKPPLGVFVSLVVAVVVFVMTIEKILHYREQSSSKLTWKRKYQIKYVKNRTIWLELTWEVFTLKADSRDLRTKKIIEVNK